MATRPGFQVRGIRSSASEAEDWNEFRVLENPVSSE